MKYIREQDSQDMIPRAIDLTLAEAKGLANRQNLTEEYFNVQSLYYHFFDLYLEEKLRLSDYEKQLKTICPNMDSVSDEEKDIYQYLSNHKYFYIRNTLHVENLLIREMRTLFNHEKDEFLSDEVRDMIENTYRKVIVTNSPKQSHFMTNYGPATPDYYAFNDSLVLGIRFAEEDERKYPSEDAWFQDYCLRRQNITNFKEEITKRFSDVLGLDVRVIEYFQDSVKKKMNDEMQK